VAGQMPGRATQFSAYPSGPRDLEEKILAALNARGLTTSTPYPGAECQALFYS